MNEEFIKQAFAELIDAHEQAFASLAAAVAEACDSAAFALALQRRAQALRVAGDNPMAADLLATAERAVRSVAGR